MINDSQKLKEYKHQWYLRNRDRITQNMKIFRRENKKLFQRKYQLKKQKYPWKRFHCNLKQRCTNPHNNRYYCYGGRGIKCLITIEEVKYLWFRDKAYEMKRPSIDRINNDGNYELSNCRFIDNLLNTSLGHRVSVIQRDLEGKIIHVWESIRQAAKANNICSQSIVNSCKRRYKIACGFIWDYNKPLEEK